MAARLGINGVLNSRDISSLHHVSVEFDFPAPLTRLSASYEWPCIGLHTIDDEMRPNRLTHLAFWHFVHKSPRKQPLSLTHARMRVAILPWRLQEDRWSRSAQPQAAAHGSVAMPSLSRASPTSMHSIDRQRSTTDTTPRERIIEGRHRHLRDDGMCRPCTLRLDKFSFFTHSSLSHKTRSRGLLRGARFHSA